MIKCVLCDERGLFVCSEKMADKTAVKEYMS
jgi:hypothetical protein